MPSMQTFTYCIEEALVHAAVVNVLVTYIYALVGIEQASTLGLLSEAEALRRAIRGCGVVF